MRRTQMYLEEAAHRALRRRAAAEGRTAASVIREAVGRYLAGAGEAEDPIREFIGRARGGPRDAAREHDRYLYGTDR